MVCLERNEAAQEDLQDGLKQTCYSLLVFSSVICHYMKPVAGV